MPTATAPRLTPAEVEAYRRDGYLLPTRDVLPRPAFAGLQAFFEDLLVRWVADGRGGSPEHMDVPHFAYPELMRWLLDDAVLDLVEPILGPDLCLFSSHFICKPAGTGKRVPWHEDSAYWKGRMDPMEVVTVWLAIDPSTPANGCMRVIPGSHRAGAAGFSRYRDVADRDRAVFASEIAPGEFDPARAVDCVLAPGRCSLHDGRLIHGSEPNAGAVRRCGLTMRYTSTAVRHRPSDDGFAVYLARGRDRAGNAYADPTRPNQAWIARHPGQWPRGH